MKPIDSSGLGPMGERAVEYLQDAGYWQRLCPELTLSSPTSIGIMQSKPFAVSDERAEVLQAAKDRDGVFTFMSDELPWA